MIQPGPKAPSLSRQCNLLGVSRSCLYYQPREVSSTDLELMRLIDEQYMKAPFYGTRSFQDHLRRLGHNVGRDKIRSLMRIMGIEAIYPRPKTSKACPEHRIYPYLLKGLTIDRPNQVWATDITYIPMRRGFFYLVAVMDWYSRSKWLAEASNMSIAAQ